MYDDLRSEMDFEEEEEDQVDYDYQERAVVARSQAQFLGMTPQQRLVISVMILMMICILGSFFLLISGSVSLPL